MGRYLFLGISKLEIIIPFIVLILLLPYTYAYFYVVPYLGITIINPLSGEISGVFNHDASNEPLSSGDKIVHVDSREWDEIRQNIINLGNELKPGSTLHLTIQRGPQTFKTTWIVPPVLWQELLERILSPWWVGYLFWIAGTLVIIFIRPKHSLRLLLAILFYLGAIWIIVGLVSSWGKQGIGIWNSSIMLHSAFWLLVPISLHFHWNFPNPLARTPKFWWIIYVVGISLVIAEWANLLPKTAYLFGGLLAAFGSIVLLLMHGILQPKHRQDVMPLVILIGISITPVILLGLATLLNPLSTVNILGLITLIAFPGSYLFAVYRHQLGDMELRHNRIVSIFVFLGLLSIIFIFGGIVIESYYRHINSTYVVALTLLSAVTASLITIIFYPPVRRFVERHIIGIPHDTIYLTETYSARITTSLDKASLNSILAEEILPSLMIRKSALYRLKGTIETQKIFSMGLSDHELPNSDVIKHFLQESQEEHSRIYHDSIIHHDSWVSLVIPLKLENRNIGVWLFGRRDPDNYYSKSEIKSLKSIADQTAIALTNIEQAEYLHKLYQTNIDRQEIERQKLALELHDQILSQLAIMIMNPKSEPNAEISDICADIAASIRKMVDGLRPAMINYGLCHAIEELCDNIYELSDNGLTIDIDLPFTDIRYQPQAELHLYRIIQQACNNILQHARAQRITISGSMEPKKVDIFVQDDGVGFHMSKTLDLPELLYKRNYGIVGMYERASLIGALLDISSSPGQGTTVHISWKTDAHLYRDDEAEKFVDENAI